jgi:hypothetical protein
MSIPDLISAVGTPLVGLFVDRYGHRTLLISLSGASVFVSMFMMTYTLISPVISMSLLGISYSAFTSSLWPCVPFLVERHQMATAYGLMSVALNITLFTVPLIIAKLRGLYPDDWTVTMRFFLTLSALSIGLSIFLYIVDLRRGGVLTRGSKSKKYGSSPTRDERRSLLSGNDEETAGTDEVSEEENLVAKVVRDGVVVAAPHTVIFHHHHIPHHHPQHQQPSPKDHHIHTTHCKCFQSQSRSRRPAGSSSTSQSARHGKSPSRRTFSIKRSHGRTPLPIQASPDPFSPQPDSLSIANSI